MEQKMNEVVLQAAGTQRELVDALTARQKRWLGHVLRHCFQCQ